MVSKAVEQAEVVYTRPTLAIAPSIADPEEHQDGGEDWLLTYCDTVTLLITFFVILIMGAVFEKQFGSNPFFDNAAAIFEGKRGASDLTRDDGQPSAFIGDDVWAEIARLRQRVEEERDAAPISSTQTGSAETRPTEPRLTRDNLAETVASAARGLDQKITEAGLRGFVTVSSRPDGVSLTLDNKILFKTGEADLRPESLIRN